MQYDLIVIGAGPGGYVAAIRAAQLGLKTAVFERAEVGGTCLNRGCIPTKTLMHSANLYRELDSAAKMGINVTGASADFKAMHARKAQVVEQLRGGVAQLLKGNGIDVIEGEAAFTSAGAICVNGETYTAKDFIIATGSKPFVPPIPGADLPGVVTSDEMLDTDACDFGELIIIGGGVIGVEMASVYNGIGRKVIIIEALDRILANMDREISQNLSMILKKRGVAVNTASTVTGITAEGGKLTCTFERKGQSESVTADGVLICVGRRAVTEGLNTEAAGIELDRGRVKVDGNYQTNVPHIYAIGDVTGGIQLAHAAEAQGIACVEHICGVIRSIDPNLVPACVYTSPEIATIGITADEAKQQGKAVITGKYIMSGNGKSIIENEERGFIKLVFEAESEKLIGAQLMCGRTTDMIGELVTAISAGLTKAQMAMALHPHPTFCEGITEAVHAADGHSIHTMPTRKR